jgi:hypothetical protein
VLWQFFPPVNCWKHCMQDVLCTYKEYYGWLVLWYPCGGPESIFGGSHSCFCNVGW